MATIPSHPGVHISPAMFESVSAGDVEPKNFEVSRCCRTALAVILEFVAGLAITSLLSPWTFAPGGFELEMLCKRRNVVLESDAIKSLNVLILYCRL